MIDIECELIENTPTISLNGNVVEYLKVGDAYTEQGASAKDYEGNDISDSITTSITGSGSSVDTSSVGNYTITYSVTIDNKTMMVIRNVIVTE